MKTETHYEGVPIQRIAPGVSWAKDKDWAGGREKIAPTKKRDAQIRALKREGMSVADIAKKFGLTRNRVYQITSENWRKYRR